MSVAMAEFVERESRELAFACDPTGTVTWADARALRHLGLAAGGQLDSLVAPGTEGKLLALLQAGCVAPASGWELAVRTSTGLATVLAYAEPWEGGARFLCSLVPTTYSQMVEQVREGVDEIITLNREISRQRKALAAQRQELSDANLALADSNRGVMTLHAELEDRADALRRSADVRARVVANVSHEFRTPLHTILGLSRLLLDRVDGPLTDEQQKQVRFIRGAAEELSEMVGDLLDLSKIESGKMNLRVERFSLGEFFGALRGMLRPTVPAGSPVELHFDVAGADAWLETDRAKLSQVMRNLISNALKFTEQGSVQVLAAMRDDGVVALSVRDTGIGIAPGDQERIFEEFQQIDSVLQRKVKGTGLGLALSRRLAALLGGTLEVESTPGVGSTFTLRIPRLLPEVEELQALEERNRALPPDRAPVLVVEDDRKTIFLYERYLSLAGYPVIPARTVVEARRALETHRPAAIVLDIMLEGETSWEFLAELKREPATAEIPVLVVTVTNREDKARALGADEFWLKPLDQERLLRKLRSLSASSSPGKVLVIDDDERARYLLRRLLLGSPYQLLEAGTGDEGVRLARDQRPDLIFLDFLLDEMTAFDVLDLLKADPETRAIPVIISTSQRLDQAEREKLGEMSQAILSKEELSRELAINRIRDALEKAGVGASVRKE